MKYILINDINNMFKRNKKILIFSFIIFIFYSFYIKKIIYDDYKVLYFMGLIFDRKYIVLVSLFLFDYIIYIYIVSSLYINDLNMSYDYLFTRMEFRRWNINKMISLFIITSIFKTVQLLIFIIINKYNINILEFIGILGNIMLAINYSLTILYVYIYRTKFSMLYTLIISFGFILLLFNWKILLNWQFLITICFIFFINIKLFISRKSSDLKLRIGG